MNISLRDRNSNEYATVNKLGFIDFWSSDSQVSPAKSIYLVLFEEYSQTNPFCSPLDISHPIEVISCDKSSLSYNKKFQDFTFRYDIQMVENGIDLSIHFAPNCANHSVGLAMPYYSNWHNFTEKTIEENIAYYSSFMHKNLPADQHVLNVPFVFSNNIIVFGNIKNNYQFFRYLDEKFSWLRVTTSTSNIDDDGIEICLRSISPISNTYLTEVYLSKFPEADKFINTWKTKFEDLGNTYGIKISCQQTETTLTRSNLKYVSNSSPTEKELQKFYLLIKPELEKYPPYFFEKLRIKHIILVSNLWVYIGTSKRKIDGQFLEEIGKEERGLVFDIQANAGLIHHEIFHAIQKEKRFCEMPGKISQISDLVLINNIDEYLAELFRILMTNPGKAYNPTLGINLEQINYLKTEIKEFLDFPELVPIGELRTIFAVDANSIKEIEFGDICDKATHYIYDPSIRDETCH